MRKPLVFRAFWMLASYIRNCVPVMVTVLLSDQTVLCIEFCSAHSRSGRKKIFYCLVFFFPPFSFSSSPTSLCLHLFSFFFIDRETDFVSLSDLVEIKRGPAPLAEALNCAVKSF